ncbi:MAG TPA: M28 family peptidase, partial [Planctomycetota bacterium]|nr:M28 family peptidase [Planctomycetota bacterium]
MLPGPALLLVTVLQLAAALPPGDPQGGTAGDPITADDLDVHLQVLASDVFEGRLAGTPGERRAAEYIRSVLESIEGLEPGGDGGTWFQDFSFSRWFVPHRSRNVVALLPGSDAELSAETIVIGAHYDHEGPGEGRIYNGADDNASGSATLLELAAALASRPERPRRTLAFHWYGAEESGLLGSAHYVRRPLRPLQDTVLMLNLDMVGRLRGRTLMVGATGSSPLFPLLLPGLCRRAGLVMKDEPRVSGNSDHWSFFRRGVPVLFLFTGFHEDYHQVSDEAWRANVAGAARIGALAAEIVLAIDSLDGDERPTYVRAQRGKERWTPRAWIGVTLEAAGEPASGAGPLVT